MMKKARSILMLTFLLVSFVSVWSIAAQDESDDFDMVVIAGTIQTQLGCAGDWLPDCENTALSYDATNGVGWFLRPHCRDL